MLKLLRFAKPYWMMLVLAIALLFAQANFDLALPDYLSRIVNTGIQQGGVEDAVPQAIRQSEMDRVVLFMSDADKKPFLRITRLSIRTPRTMKPTWSNILSLRMSPFTS
jgi:ATP-binding cassette, subfamily B, multidrug efflux pump